MNEREFNEITAGIDYHLRKIDDFSAELHEVKGYLEQLRVAQQNDFRAELNEIKKQVAFLAAELQNRGLPGAAQYEATYQALKSQSESTLWPAAVEQELICDTPPKAAERASHILSLVVGEQLNNRRFLDYGCGEGHVVAAALQRQALAQGYDINSDQSKVGNLITTYFASIKSNGPYEVILAHDVLDHIQNISPVQALLEMKSVLAPEGKIYVRCHPWCSRHGGHLYTKINKAFLHLAMDEVELMRCGGYKADTSCDRFRVFTPLETYPQWFAEAGLSVLSEMPSYTDVENYYFETSPVRERVLKHWNGNEMAARNNMKVDFVEYVLRYSPQNAAE